MWLSPNLIGVVLTNQKFSLFNNVQSTEPELEIDLDYFIELVRSEEFKAKIHPLRDYIAVDGPDSKRYSQEKKALPAVTLAGIFQDGRKDEHLAVYSGVVHLDLDKLDPELPPKYLDILRKDPQILFAFTSPSGRGVKIGGCHNKGVEQHEAAYYAFKAHVRALLECTDSVFDNTVRSLSRLCFVSWDARAHYNPSALFVNPQPAPQQIPPSSYGQVEEVLAAAVKKIEAAEHGEKHNTRLYQARLVGGYVAAGYLEEKAALEHLEKAAQRNTNTPDSAVKDIRDGFAHGKQSPIYSLNRLNAGLPEGDLDVAAVLGEALPTLPAGILQPDIEKYLRLVAESLDVNYEAAFCELLVNVCIAIGGNKKITVRYDYQQKALLWLATIGASGSGKSPLNLRCGGELLKQQQFEWWEQFKQEKEQWGNQESPRPPTPVRRRWLIHSLTIEQLCELHQENPAGIGYVSDEITSLLEGLNQYKGRGNDKQKLLTFWNGQSFENPTAESDRIIPSVFVPIAGGIQESMVRKLINDANTSDGLAARFLFNHIVMTREPASIERQRQIDLELEISTGKQALGRIFRRLVGIREDEYTVSINAAARDLLGHFDHSLKLEARKGSDQELAAFQKLRAYVYRIALTLHYLIEDRPDTVELSGRTARHTIDVTNFFIAGMKRAYGGVTLTDQEKKSQIIVRKLQQLGGKAKHKDIKQPIKKTVPFAESARLISRLIEVGVVKEVAEGRERYLELVNR
jgi:hypothetical protein